MPTQLVYNLYKHSIRSAYNSLGITQDISDSGLSFVEYEQIDNLEPHQVIEYITHSIKLRLQKVGTDILDEFLDSPRYRRIFFNNTELIIPLLNKQAVEWYGNSGLINFDCAVESFIGMHANARTIYDIGGHQGVWAAYYSLVVGETGRVYTFEPSIINFECSSLLFLINNMANVVNIPFGIGTQTLITKKQGTGLLVDFVEQNIGLLRFDQVFFERADFIKIDIEGYEYEFIKSFSNIFEFCPNIHLELHIPHLEKRGLDYRDIYTLIPFDKVNVLLYQHLKLRPVGKTDLLDGFCSLLITRK